MKILIDIGNTNTSIAVVQGKRILKRHFIHTSKKDICPAVLRRLLGSSLEKTESVIVVSVVPKFLTVLRKSLKVVAGDIPVKVVGKNIKVPMKIKYRDPKEVGQDRLVAAFAARKVYKTPLLVVDFGTAVTFDFIGKTGAYEGGLIFPGIRLALSSLSSHAALLPKKVDVKSPRSIVGRDTKSSMNAGVVLGYASMCDGIISRFRSEYGNNISIVATGGDAALIAKYSHHIKNISSDLIFKGLMDLSGS